MRAVLLTLAVVLIAAPSLSGQARRPDRTDLELVVLARPGLLLGAQVEYAAIEHAAPWLSVRYGTHNAVCLDGLLGSECGTKGVSALAGVRLKAGHWGPVEPYLTLGVGRLWWDDDEREATPWRDDAEATGTAHLGLVWMGFGRIRPRIEVGYESHVSPWMNVGIGFVP